MAAKKATGTTSTQNTTGQSKTSRASMRVGEGNKRVACAWIMNRIPGKMQRKPVMTFYSVDEFNAVKNQAELDGVAEDYVFIQWANVGRK